MTTEPLFDHEEPVYIISVAARMLGVQTQTLRYYERLGLVEPARTKGNQRVFSHSDVERVSRIRGLMDDLGVNLKPARAMGMTTIKVGDPATAIAELEQVLGIRLG